MSETTVFKTCSFCEAICGIAITLRDGDIVTIRGDKDDPFSRGYICPKAYGLKGLHEDPDRLTAPVKRTATGFEEISWDEAFDLAIAGLTRVRDAHGAQALGTYLGNPNAHNMQSILYGPVLQRALGTKQRYSATSADQLPKQVTADLMFGGGLNIPIPDVDRTQFFLILGANPIVSNGSLMTAPDLPGRLKALQARGGRIVVIDPRRTETAAIANAHHFIRPGGDVFLLLAMLHVLFRDKLVDLGALDGHVDGVEEVAELVRAFPPAAVELRTGIAASAIEGLARDFASAESAVCYGRIGTTCQEFGTLASWAVDVLNTVTGNLDRPGGAMFIQAPVKARSLRPPKAQTVKFDRWRSRVEDLPEAFGELPVATLANEITTPGDGQIRAMLTLAGNPVLSAPGAGDLDDAFGQLEFMASIDFYINETTRHADVILPPPSPMHRANYDILFGQLAIRRVAKYAAPALPADPDHPDEWMILLTLAKGMMGMRSLSLLEADNFLLGQMIKEELVPDRVRLKDLTAEEVLEKLTPDPGPARLLDLLLRLGPDGDGFGRVDDGLTLDVLRQNPHGIDLGPMAPRIPHNLTTPTGRVQLAPERVVIEIPALARQLDTDPDPCVLIGRRHLRSNNSWMHNVKALVKGKDRCTLLIHPEDAARLGLSAGESATVSSRIGAIRVPVELSDEMMPGVVSLPHGWGHDLDGVQLQVAAVRPGVNVNLVSDQKFRDGITGNAAFNGVPVTVEPAARRFGFTGPGRFESCKPP